MLLESKIKQAAILAAVDIQLKKRKLSPKRCSRNLLELGMIAYPGKLSKEEQSVFQEQLMNYCRNENGNEARALFINTFLEMKI